MPDRLDRVQVWGSQLAHADFPPICAITGRDAEVWRKFKFTTVPSWTYAVLVLTLFVGLGIFIHLAVRHLAAKRAAGYLPLSRLASRTISIAVWFPIALLASPVVLVILAVTIASKDSHSDAPGFMLLLAIVLFAGGLVARLLFRAQLFPQAGIGDVIPVYGDRIIELRNLHPRFVTAVRYKQDQVARHFTGRIA
ncbi:MAG TPA: hypothetical protein VKE27_05375 [Candidatus Dormibacteraeota bacterium]|nr:hypothetical protein [Candidatus Dormibacteraeota bacterium]